MLCVIVGGVADLLVGGHGALAALFTVLALMAAPFVGGGLFLLLLAVRFSLAWIHAPPRPAVPHPARPPSRPGPPSRAGMAGAVVLGGAAVFLGCIGLYLLAYALSGWLEFGQGPFRAILTLIATAAAVYLPSAGAARLARRRPREVVGMVATIILVIGVATMLGTRSYGCRGSPSP